MSEIALEEKATARFRSYRDELVRQLGRGPLTSDTIGVIGPREFGALWGGRRAPGASIATWSLLHREHRMVPP